MDTGTLFSAFASVLWTLYVATSFALFGQNGISVNVRHSDQWLSRSIAATCVPNAQRLS